jgi:hypothetical protein
MRKLLFKSEKESEKSKDAAGKPPSSTSKKKSKNRNHHKKKELTPEEIQRKIARERVKNEIVRLYILKQKQNNQKRARA